MTKRINHIGLIVGKRGTGKTTFGKEKIVAASKMPKVLVVDTINHGMYANWPVITIDKLKYWKKGNYRLIITGDETEAALTEINTYCNNCLIIFEDAVKYLNPNLQPAVVSLFVDSKQKNIDVFLMYHEYTFVPPKVYRYTDSITVFKTKSSPFRRKNEINMYDEVQSVWDRVKAHPSPYYCLTIETA
ncbi:hypothetical protein QQ054_01025 [Oscillatoria amoena NRMC-F 0135]|nr:hypothetical protein [Oscillatoria amoena NRMC-F 0135]